MNDQDIKYFLDSCFRLFNDKWVRGEINKNQQLMFIDAGWLATGIKDSYTKVRATKAETQQDLPWPSPGALDDENVFYNAALKGVAAAKRVLKRSRISSLDPTADVREDYVRFNQKRADRSMAREIKTAAINYLEKEMKRLSPDSHISTFKELKDQNYSDADARKNDNWALRRGIQVMHQGTDTTGAGQGSVVVQGIRALAPNFEQTLQDEKYQDASQYLGTLLSSYQVLPTAKGLVKVQPTGPTKTALGSYKVNVQNPEAGDLRQFKDDFTRIVGEVLKDPKIDLASFAGLTKKQMDAQVLNQLGERMVSQISGAELRGRIDLVNWVVGQKVTLSRKHKRIGPQMLKKYTKTSAVDETAREKDSFSAAAIKRAQELKIRLESRINDVVAANMKAPALVWRTGRFSSSVEIANVTSHAKTLEPVVSYKYQRDPYGTFDIGGKMYTTDRDPYKLISKSIREIAKEMMIHRLRVMRQGRSSL